jgi:hypothetical protein
MISIRAGVRDLMRNNLAERTFTPRFFRITSEMSLIATMRLPQLTRRVLLLLAANDETVDNDQTLETVQQLRRTAVTTATLTWHHRMQFEIPQEIVTHISQWLQHHRGVAVRPA